MAAISRSGSSRRRTAGRTRRRIIGFLVFVALAPAVAAAGLIALFASLDPPRSALMLWRGAAGSGTDYRPVPLSAIAPVLAHAVLTSEDNRFCLHEGVDWSAVEEALDEAERGGRLRGASTITMQVAKNLFLWPERSWARKALEAPLALLIERMWPKRRILEVYLNIAEWGPGIYGAEAAVRAHFGISASALTRRQAALLAAALPAPLLRSAGRPGPATERAAARIERRMAQTEGLFGCIDERRD